MFVRTFDIHVPYTKRVRHVYRRSSQPNGSGGEQRSELLGWGFVLRWKGMELVMDSGPLPDTHPPDAPPGSDPLEPEPVIPIDIPKPMPVEVPEPGVIDEPEPGIS